MIMLKEDEVIAARAFRNPPLAERIGEDDVAVGEQYHSPVLVRQPSTLVRLPSHRAEAQPHGSLLALLSHIRACRDSIMKARVRQMTDHSRRSLRSSGGPSPAGN